MLRRASAGSSHFLAGGDMNALVPEMGLDCVPQNPLEFTLYITQIACFLPSEKSSPGFWVFCSRENST